MKSATLPSVRVEPDFPNEVEQALQPGETLTSLVEATVRAEVTRRKGAMRHQRESDYD